MAATKNTLAALWGKKLQDERKTKSSDHGSVISTRSRAPEDRNAQEKEATSRLSKPDEQAPGPIELPTRPTEDEDDAKVQSRPSACERYYVAECIVLSCLCNDTSNCPRITLCNLELSKSCKC